MLIYMVLVLASCLVGAACLKHKVALPTQIGTLSASTASVQHLLGVLKRQVLEPQETELERTLPVAITNLKALADEVEGKAGEDLSEAALSTWFYTAVDEAVGREENGFDPFRAAKFAELASDATSAYVTDLSVKLLDFADEELAIETLRNVVELSLWGTRERPLEITPKQSLNAAQLNAAAFGNDPEIAAAVAQTRKIGPRQRRQSFTNVLGDNRRLIQNEAYAPEVDVLTKVTSFLSDARGKGGAMHIVTENAGHGLIADLLLGHVLLNLGVASKVHYHAKPFSCGSPLSVTPTDISGHIEHLADPTKGGDIWNVRHFGEALRRHVVSGDFVLEDPDPFWADLGEPLYEMPPSLEQCFTEAACTFVKGDRMFKRMLGNLDWKAAGCTSPEALSYWPGPLCVLHTVGNKGAIETLF